LTFEEIENYKGHFAVIFAHASFLFLMLLREMIKDLENIKGDLAVTEPFYSILGKT
jgi:4-hydroxybenzoate polyprenyltransferase